MTTQVSLSTVQSVIAQAIDLHPSDVSRIERAAVLIALDAVRQLDDVTFAVRSQTDGETAYTVTPNGCTYVDAARRPNSWCKHQYAARITLAAQQQEEREATRRAEQAARARVTADRVAIAYARSIKWAA